MIGRTGFASDVLIVCKELLAAGLLCAGLLSAGSAHAVQVLEAADHAEVDAEISATAVNRIALERDRVIRVVQPPGGLRVEHDPVRGDVYLYPDAGIAADGEPVVLYLGTEQGRTYRLSLSIAERDSAQILIRNPEVVGADRGWQPRADPHADEVVKLIGAVARAEPLPGYSIAPAGGSDAEGSAEGDNGMHRFPVLETWHGPRWTARILQVPKDGPADAVEVVAMHDSRALAAWLSAAGYAPGGDRLAVIVEANDAEAAVR